MPTRGVGRVAGGDDHHRVAGADDDGAVGLFGQFAGFDRQRAVADRDFSSMCSWNHCACVIGVAVPAGRATSVRAPRPTAILLANAELA